MSTAIRNSSRTCTNGSSATVEIGVDPIRRDAAGRDLDSKLLLVSGDQTRFHLRALSSNTVNRPGW